MFSFPGGIVRSALAGSLCALLGVKPSAHGGLAIARTLHIPCMDIKPFRRKAHVFPPSPRCGEGGSIRGEAGVLPWLRGVLQRSSAQTYLPGGVMTPGHVYYALPPRGRIVSCAVSVTT